MSTALDRESLRARLRLWSELERRIAIERAVEHLTDAALESFLAGLVHLDKHRTTTGSLESSLCERIDRHAAATRCGELLGEYALRNAYGQREPWQTTAWLAATVCLFDFALKRAGLAAFEDTMASLAALTVLVEEVDERIDELVVFEDSCACDALSHELALARDFLNRRSNAGHMP